MNICIIGAGAWGTAMAFHLNRVGHVVTLVPRRFEHAMDLSSSRENGDYLPGVFLPMNLQIAHELRPALMEAEVVLLACPSYGIRQASENIRKNLDSARSIRFFLSLAKGLEQETLLRPTEVMREVLPEYIHGVLAGPSYAMEVAKGFPTAVVLAVDSSSADTGNLQSSLSGKTLRIYSNRDLLGVELGGCLKNIYAVAAGCSEGLGLGDNARAALLTRALAEMVRLGVALGAQAETFYGLSGFGDLIATCNGEWSRNRTFGQKIGEGFPITELLSQRKTVVEGYRTTEAFYRLCRTKELNAPILAQVYAILYEAKGPKQALDDLMTRELTSEED
ncbi:MAG: NAD(P)H-dependent glycerol-3-phosphate dehydrogenase [Opitutales bacterium]